VLSDATLLGIDVGGTFTDVVLHDGATGATLVEKVSSTPGQPGVGVLDGIRRLHDVHGVDLGAVDLFTHGSTVATNALLEHKLPRTALVVTEGFRDVLEIGDQRREFRLAPGFEHHVDPVHERVVREAARDELVPELGDHLIPLGVRGAQTGDRLLLVRRGGDLGRRTSHGMQYRDQPSATQGDR